MATETKTNDAIKAAILKQVEFYFGDSNLPKDKFLSAAVKEDKDSYVPIAKIASFKRLQALTTDIAVVVEALKGSATLLEVSEDGTKVRRKTPLPTEVDATPRIVYSKGFPIDATLESIQDFFKVLGDVRCVRMRYLTKNKKKEFKGSVFVEFGTKEEAEKIAAQTITLPGSSAPLTMHTKEAYVAKKIAEGKSVDGGDKKGKKRTREDKKDGATGEAAAPAVEAAIVPDLIIAIDAMPEGASREDLKDFFTTAGAAVQYVDYSRGEAKAFVRLGAPAEGKESKLATTIVTELAASKAQLGGAVPTLRALTGEEEKEYWAKVRSRQHTAKKGRGGGRGGRGGGRGRGGRGGGRGKPNKKAKTE